jgi:ketosteroid isomerase-like protein
MTAEDKERLARTFLSVLSHPDPEVIKKTTVDDVIWSFPGTSPISGEAHGVDGIMKRARTIASYGVKVEFIRAVFSLSSVAIFLHNTGNKNDRVLDEQVAAVFTLRGDKISRLDTFLSDVAMAEAFFAEA